MNTHIPQKMVRDLRDAGMTQAQIAKACNRSQGYISDVASGNAGSRRPTDDFVRRLRDLHARVLRRKARLSNTPR